MGAGSVWLRLEQALRDGLGGLEVAEGFGKCGVIECVIALDDEEPELRVESIGPVRLHGENLGKEAGGLVGLVTVGLELGAFKQGEKIGTVLLASGVGACPHFLQDTGALGGDVGKGLIHTFLCEDAGHLIEDLCGPAGTLDLGEGIGQFIDAGEAACMGLFGRFAETLAFLPALGPCRLGEGGLVGALGGLEQLGADFLAGNVASLCADLLDVPMLPVTEPPDAAADEDQEDKDNGEGAEDFVLPEVEGLAQLGQFIAEALDLKVQVGVAGGVVVSGRRFAVCRCKRAANRGAQPGSWQDPGAQDH